MGCKAVGHKFDEWCQVGTGLRGLVGDLFALGTVKSFGCGIQVQAFAAKVNNEDRFGNTAGRYQSTILAMTQGASREVSSAVP